MFRESPQGRPPTFELRQGIFSKPAQESQPDPLADEELVPLLEIDGEPSVVSLTEATPARMETDATGDFKERYERLTPRQRQIMLRYALGNTYQQVAQELGVRTTTVRTHAMNAYETLELNSRTALIHALRAIGLLDRASATASEPQASRTDSNEPLGSWSPDRIEDFKGRLRRLTQREKEVLPLYYRGRTAREVAAALTISLKTAETYFDNIRKKMGVTNRTNLLQALYAVGLLNQDLTLKVAEDSSLSAEGIERFADTFLALGPDQQQLARLMMHRVPLKQIAARTGFTMDTVSQRLYVGPQAIYRRLGVRSQEELIRFARAAGILGTHGEPASG